MMFQNCVSVICPQTSALWSQCNGVFHGTQFAVEFMFMLKVSASPPTIVLNILCWTDSNCAVSLPVIFSMSSSSSFALSLSMGSALIHYMMVLSSSMVRFVFIAPSRLSCSGSVLSSGYW
eukprot:14063027-Heterocapsa_arctica.AAC.1